MNPHLLKNLDVSSFDAVVISDYDKGFVDTDTAAAIIKFAKSIPVFVDSKKNDLSCYRGCIIKINEQESRNALNVPDGDLIITLGSRGCVWNDMLFEAEKVSVFDVCGAGDTFLASLVTGYLSTSDMPYALAFANRCSAIAVSNFGAYTIKLEDLI
jgi:D-beta-D-heptose 7-phosphate kinase/D-beta-D-heptose 1-phosphate adenosyltransferase